MQQLPFVTNEMIGLMFNWFKPVYKIYSNFFLKLSSVFLAITKLQIIKVDMFD